MFSQGCKQISGRKTRSKISFQFSSPILHFLDHAIFYLRENKQTHTEKNKIKKKKKEILIWDVRRNAGLMFQN